MGGRTHGAASNYQRTPEYLAWSNMRRRCLDPQNPRYAAYGGRGIAIDPRWDDFAVFLLDVGLRPSPQHSLDRRDNDLGYTKDNCRWALPLEQATNRRNTLYIEETPLSVLAKQYGIPANTLRFRILRGMDLQEALTKPIWPREPSAT